MNRIQKAMLTVLGLKQLTTQRSYSLTDAEFGTALQRLLGMSTYTGKTVTEDNSMSVSAFWACIRLLSRTVGGLPASVYERDRNTGNLTKIDHDLNDVLFAQPNSEMDRVGHWEAMTANIAQQGNGVSIIARRSDGSLISSTPIPAGRVSVGRDRYGDLVYDINDRGKWETYPADKVWHVRDFSFNGLVGLSPLVYHRNMLAVSMSAEEFQAKFFANGASPSFIVSVPQWLNEGQRKIARENLDQLWGGLENAHKARLLEGGMKPEGGTMPLKEAQFQELRGFSVEEVCRAMGVPQHMVGKLDRSTNNNIEQQSLEFVMYSIMPYTTRFESSISRWLFRPEERKRFVVRFNIDGLLRADSAARGELISKLRQSGILSANEGRQLEGRNRVDAPGMDDYHVQGAMVPLAMLQQLAEKAVRAPVAQPQPKAVPPLDLTLVLDRLGEHKVNLFNLLQGPDQQIHVAQPSVHTGDTKVDVAAPGVTVNGGGDSEQMAKCIALLGGIMAEISKGQKEDTAVRARILEHVKSIEDKSQ